MGDSSAFSAQRSYTGPVSVSLFFVDFLPKVEETKEVILRLLPESGHF